MTRLGDVRLDRVSWDPLVASGHGSGSFVCIEAGRSRVTTGWGGARVCH
jgi:hypothetical protein